MSTHAAPPPSADSPYSFVGEVNTIGEFGPIYEVGRPLRQQDDGDWLMEITLVESGEVTDYLLSSIKEDPEAV